MESMFKRTKPDDSPVFLQMLPQLLQESGAEGAVSASNPEELGGPLSLTTLCFRVLAALCIASLHSEDVPMDQRGRIARQLDRESKGSALGAPQVLGVHGPTSFAGSPPHRWEFCADAQPTSSVYQGPILQPRACLSGRHTC